MWIFRAFAGQQLIKQLVGKFGIFLSVIIILFLVEEILVLGSKGNWTILDFEKNQVDLFQLLPAGHQS